MDPKLLRESIDVLHIEEDDDLDRHAQLEHEYESLQDAIEEFQRIQEELLSLRSELVDAIRGYAPESLARWEAYGLAQLAIVAGSDEYMSHDESINNLIGDLEDKMAEIRDEMSVDETVDKGAPVRKERF